MKISNDDKIRQKIDGFSLNSTNENTLENRFVTTDQGVYNKPDDSYKTTNEDKKVNKKS